MKTQKPTAPPGTQAPPAKPAVYLGLLEIDVPTVLSHLRRDLRDDWFPDPLNFDDCLTEEFVASRLLDLQSDAALGYQATDRHERDVPKPGGSLRYSLETTLIDRFVYQALVEQFARSLDALQSPSAFSHRVETLDRKAFFKPAVPQWQLFEDATNAAIPGKWVVEADLQNFYESIILEHLRTALLKGIQDSAATPSDKSRQIYATNLLMQLLPKWCYSPTHGLPQNRDASSFLANQYMREIDKQMKGEDVGYFRYMDDIRITVDTRDSARRELVNLIRALRTKGLSLNSKKTQIHAPESDWHQAALAPKDLRLRNIDNMWGSRSKETIARSLVYIAELATELAEKKEIGTRAFRFCINRLQRLSTASDIDIEMPERDVLKQMVLKELVEDPSAADTLCNFLRSVKITHAEAVHLENLLLNETAYLYEWQRFQIALVLLDHGNLSQTFSDAVSSSLSLQESTRPVPRDIALVIAGSTDAKARRLVAERYKDLCTNHTLHRAALIAVHELNYADAIQPTVQPHVPPSLRGVFKLLSNKSRRGKYFEGWEKIHSSSLIDALSSYV